MRESEVDFTIQPYIIGPECDDSKHPEREIQDADLPKKNYEEFLRQERVRPQLQEVIIERKRPTKKRQKKRKEDLPN